MANGGNGNVPYNTTKGAVEMLTETFKTFQCVILWHKAPYFYDPDIVLPQRRRTRLFDIYVSL